MIDIETKDKTPVQFLGTFERLTRTSGMKKRLTLRHVFGLPFVFLAAVGIVFLWGMLFSDALAATQDIGASGWLAQNIAPVMFFFMFFMLLLGYPTAFTLAGVGMLFGLVGIKLGLLEPSLFALMPGRIYGVMSNEIMLAVPFFTFMGLVLERSGMAEDLLDIIGHLFGRMRGGLAYAVIFVGALLAATTGIVAASVIAMGLISLPIMLRYGYDRKLASGVIAASGTLAQIIPPSLVLIIMADQLGRSVGDMYIAAVIPGFLLTLLYAGWIFVYSVFINRNAAPGLPVDAIKYRKPDGGRGFISLIVLIALGALVAFVFVRLGGRTLEPGEWVMHFFLRMTFIAFLFAALDGSNQEDASLQKKTSIFPGKLKWVVAPLGFASLIFLGVTLGIVTPEDGVFGIVGVFFLFALKYVFRSRLREMLSPLAKQVIFVMVPPLVLIFLVLGTIIVGLATPTEAGAFGAFGALILAALKRMATGEANRFNFDVVYHALLRTAILSAFVFFILIGARMFTLTFYGLDGHHWVEGVLVQVTGNPLSFLILISILIFFLAFFLDFFELAFIAVPLIAPAAESLGIDLVWLGVILSVNMQTSFMHPPFGFALIYLRSVAPKNIYKDLVTGEQVEPVTTGQIYLGAVPYVIIQIIMVGLVIAFPTMVSFYKSNEVLLDDAAVAKEIEMITDPSEFEFELPDFN